MDLDGWFVDNQTGEQIMNPSKPQVRIGHIVMNAL